MDIKSRKIARRRRQIVTFAVGTALLSFPGWAQAQMGPVAESARPYYFGGSCTSRGKWTDEVLDTAALIRKAATNLRNDKNCKALPEKIFAAIEAIEAGIKGSPASSEKITEASRIEQAQTVLNSNLSHGYEGVFKGVPAAAIQTSIEAASINTGSMATKFMSRATGAFTPLTVDAGKLARQGLTAFNTIIDSMATDSECLLNQNVGQLQLFSLSVKMLSSLSSSLPSSTGSELSNAVLKLTDYFKEHKFSASIRELNTLEFRSSLQCLIEVTSETFCAINDDFQLFQRGMKALENRKADVHTNKSPDYGLKSDNPFNGYMVLTRHVPNITSWLRQVQFGVDPTVPTDADFQNGLIKQVSDFLQTTKRLIAAFNGSLTRIEGYSDDTAKLQEARTLAINLVDLISNSSGFSMQNQEVNFFLKRVPSTKLPFYLIGMNPENLSSGLLSILSNQPDAWRAWFSGQDLVRQVGDAREPVPPVLMDHKRLIAALQSTLFPLIDQATQTAEELYNTLFLVDKQKLVIDAMTSTGFSVHESLEATLHYLNLLDEKMTKYDTSTAGFATRAMIRDTQERIKTVLNAFAALRSVGENMAQKPTLTLEERQESLQAFVNVINSTYREFIVLLARSGFISGRLTTLVKKDFEITLKNKIDLSSYEQELIFATGNASLDRILSMYDRNPGAAQQDLHQAGTFSAKSLHALEIWARDYFIGQLSMLRLTAQNKRPNGYDVNWDSLKRLRKDTMSTIGGIISPIGGFLWNALQHASRYNWYGVLDTQRGGYETENEDFKSVIAQMCIQSLAFTDYRLFEDLCKGTVLESPFAEATQAKDGKTDTLSLSVAYDEAKDLCIHHATGKRWVCVKPRQGGALSLSKSVPTIDPKDVSIHQRSRICSYREYNRKNLVYYLTRGLKLGDGERPPQQ